MAKKALITGITGQDGSYLAELLISKGYEVHGIIRRASTFNTGRINHIYMDPHGQDARLFLHYGDLSDSEQVSNIIYNIRPDEVYHLGAQSHVRVSFDIPEYSGNITGLGTTRILEAIRRSGNHIRFYQASSSEMFGAAPAPQNEETPFMPRSPYACSKVYSYWMAVNYREGYDLFICNGILFNHESPRRGETFVTRKIARAVAAISAGLQRHLYLGNLGARRDWGYAPEYVEAMHRMLQLDTPGDFVLGTGDVHSVREFAEMAFDYVGLKWEDHVRIDERYMRPTDVEELVADPARAWRLLGCEPRLHFEDLVKVMVDTEMRRYGLDAPGEGDGILERKFPNRWWKEEQWLSGRANESLSQAELASLAHT
jgi:GDPmannose 4,6-dehydratase